MKKPTILVDSSYDKFKFKEHQYLGRTGEFIVSADVTQFFGARTSYMPDFPGTPSRLAMGDDWIGCHYSSYRVTSYRPPDAYFYANSGSNQVIYVKDLFRITGEHKDFITIISATIKYQVTENLWQNLTKQLL